MLIAVLFLTGSNWKLFIKVKFILDCINDNIIIKYGLQSLAYLVSGEHIVAYWYIPMILIMFLLSPLHILFIKLKFNQQVLIF